MRTASRTCGRAVVGRSVFARTPRARRRATIAESPEGAPPAADAWASPASFSLSFLLLEQVGHFTERLFVGALLLEFRLRCRQARVAGDAIVATAGRAPGRWRRRSRCSRCPASGALAKASIRTRRQRVGLVRLAERSSLREGGNDDVAGTPNLLRRLATRAVEERRRELQGRDRAGAARRSARCLPKCGRRRRSRRGGSPCDGARQDSAADAVTREVSTTSGPNHWIVSSDSSSTCVRDCDRRPATRRPCR